LGNLHRHPVALSQARDLAQIDGQRIRHLVDLREGLSVPFMPLGRTAGESGRRAIGLGHAADHVGQDCDRRAAAISARAHAARRTPSMGARHLP
jgi:hypothetical protein